MPARVPSSNSSAIAGQVTSVTECGAAGSRRGSERSGISLRCEPWHSEGGWSSQLDNRFDVEEEQRRDHGACLAASVRAKSWLFQVGKTAPDASLEFCMRGRLIPSRQRGWYIRGLMPTKCARHAWHCVRSPEVDDSLSKPFLPVLRPYSSRIRCFLLVPFDEFEQPRLGGEEVCVSPHFS